MTRLVKHTFYDFEDWSANPPSRQVRRQAERRKDKKPVTITVRKTFTSLTVRVL